MSQRWGGRAAFLAAGGTGLVLAVAAGLRLDEPERGRAGLAPAGRAPGSPIATARVMWRTRPSVTS
jgi:hypothetical protein